MSKSASSRKGATSQSAPNMLFLDRLPVPEDDRIGAKSDGFHMILHGLNPERILIAAEAFSIGCAALRSHRLRQRAPGVRPQDRLNQAFQRPVAKCCM
jgi:acyl-CoA dehydrogenase